MKKGNYALRLPASLKKYVEEISSEDGTTMNQFIVSAVAEKVSVLKTAEFFAARAKRANPGTLDRILSRSGGQPPQAGDEIWRDGMASIYTSDGHSPRVGIEFPEVFLEIADKEIVGKMRTRMLESNPIPVPIEITLAELRQLIGAPGQLDAGSISFPKMEEVRFDILNGPKGFRLIAKKGGPRSRDCKISWLRENLFLKD